jgi:hypothetical protein
MFVKQKGSGMGAAEDAERAAADAEWQRQLEHNAEIVREVQAAEEAITRVNEYNQNN